MFEFIGDALGAIASGGITSLIGVGITGWSEYKKQKEAYRHEEAMANIAKDSMRLEAELGLKTIETEAEANIAIQESEAFEASFSHDKRSYFTGELGSIGRFLMVSVDFLRGIIRPSMTIYMTVLTTLLYFEVQTLVGGIEAIPVSDAMAILKQIIMVILYITTTVTLWWFGTRQKIIQPGK